MRKICSFGAQQHLLPVHRTRATPASPSIEETAHNSICSSTSNACQPRKSIDRRNGMSSGRHNHGVLTDAALLERGRNTDVEDRAVHCDECRQLDYLPLKCPCSRVLCSACTTQHISNCPEYVAARDAAMRLKNRLAPQCPSCSATLLSPKVEFNATDAAWAAAVEKRVATHRNSGCTLFLYEHAAPADGSVVANAAGGSSSNQKKGKSKGPRCKAKGCKARLLAGTANKATCGECNRDFCLRHRFASDHGCSGTPADTPTNQNQNPSASVGGPSSARGGAGAGAGARSGRGTGGFESCIAAAARLTPWAAAAERRRQHQPNVSA